MKWDSMSRELVITIIGFGNIGKTLGVLLLPFSDFNFNINIIDTDWDVLGAVLDLEHAAQFYDNHQISHNSEALLKNSDFVFHCAGASVPKGKSRMVTCQASIEITETIFQHFNPVKQPFIIVVANPVEIITFITQKLTGLPPERVIGTGTLLDSIRMNYIVKQTHQEIDSVEAIILGEHGTSAFLSEQLSRVNGLTFSSLFDKDTLEELLITMKASAYEIKKTQEATIYGVSYCALQIFESLLSSKGQKLPVSTAIPEKFRKDLGGADLYLSLFSEISQKGAHPVQDYYPDAHEMECLRKSIALLQQSIPEKYR